MQGSASNSSLIYFIKEMLKSVLKALVKEIKVLIFSWKMVKKCTFNFMNV